MVRAGGQVYTFGNTVKFAPYVASQCNPVVGIIANPNKQGYRLVTRTGATVARGIGVAGPVPTGSPKGCK